MLSPRFIRGNLSFFSRDASVLLMFPHCSEFRALLFSVFKLTLRLPPFSSLHRRYQEGRSPGPPKGLSGVLHGRTPWTYPWGFVVGWFGRKWMQHPTCLKSLPFKKPSSGFDQYHPYPFGRSYLRWGRIFFPERNTLIPFLPQTLHVPGFLLVPRLCPHICFPTVQGSPSWPNDFLLSFPPQKVRLVLRTFVSGFCASDFPNTILALGL